MTFTNHYTKVIQKRILFLQYKINVFALPSTLASFCLIDKTKPICF